MPLKSWRKSQNRPRMNASEVVARLNVRETEITEKHRVCQISYDSQLGSERAAVLRRSGYEVISVYGNEAARVILSTTEQPCHAFIVGHGASQEQRREMLLWLKERFPTSRVIVMNGPGISPLPGADYNVKLNGPENLLPVIETALGASYGAA